MNMSFLEIVGLIAIACLVVEIIYAARGEFEFTLSFDGDSDCCDLVDHIERQQEFSLRTFGPGARTAGLIDHIRKELIEIERAPSDLTEWIDVVMLGLDGAWRSGHEPEEIARALRAKLEKNISREWPDWRTADPDKAIEHVRGGGAA